MKITLEEWIRIHQAASTAKKALQSLQYIIHDITLTHHEAWNKDEVAFLIAASDRCSAADTLALELQSEWLGGDSADKNNHGLREPNAVRWTGHIPHLIPNSRGVETP